LPSQLGHGFHRSENGRAHDIPPLVAHYCGMTLEARVRGPWWWPRPVAWGLASVSAVSVGVAVVASVVGGLSLAGAVNGFVVTNIAMALSFSLCGLFLAVFRPANPIGWFFLAGGLAHAITAAAVGLVAVGLSAAWPLWVLRGGCADELTNFVYAKEEPGYLHGHCLVPDKRLKMHARNPNGAMGWVFLSRPAPMVEFGKNPYIWRIKPCA